jgi:hypothetical protein
MKSRQHQATQKHIREHLILVGDVVVVPELIHEQRLSKSPRPPEVGKVARGKLLDGGGLVGEESAFFPDHTPRRPPVWKQRIGGSGRNGGSGKFAQK